MKAAARIVNSLGSTRQAKLVVAIHSFAFHSKAEHSEIDHMGHERASSTNLSLFCQIVTQRKADQHTASRDEALRQTQSHSLFSALHSGSQTPFKDSRVLRRHAATPQK